MLAYAWYNMPCYYSGCVIIGMISLNFKFFAFAATTITVLSNKKQLSLEKECKIWKNICKKNFQRIIKFAKDFDGKNLASGDVRVNAVSKGVQKIMGAN